MSVHHIIGFNNFIANEVQVLLVTGEGEKYYAITHSQEMKC